MEVVGFMGNASCVSIWSNFLPKGLTYVVGSTCFSFAGYQAYFSHSCLVSLSFSIH